MKLNALFNWKNKESTAAILEKQPAEQVEQKDEKKQELNQLHYEWIDNDGLLRDEGVLFGIADADTADKIAAIENRFMQLASPIENKIRLIDQNIAKLNLLKEEVEQDVSKFEVQKIQLETSKQKCHYHLLPMIIQLIAYISICYFNFYLTSYWLAPVFDNNFITIGIYVFGLFSVFIGRTVFYNNDKSVQNEEAEQGSREKWKVWLEELGIPFVVSLFIVVLSYRNFPLEQSVVVFLLFFFLFSFSGKGLINSLYRLRREWGLNFVQFKERLKAKSEIRILNDRLKGMDSELDKLKTDIDKEEEKRLAPVNELSEVKSLLTYKINLFISEYNLAKETSQKLSGATYSAIKNN